MIKLDYVSADARNYPERPMKYGVNVYQGAFIVYNFNPKEGSEIKVFAENISLGRANAPVIGSGIFISGFNDETSKVVVEKLTTGDIYSNGMIPTGQPNLITKCEDVVAYHVNAGKVNKFSLKGKIKFDKDKSKAVVVENNGESDLSDLKEYM